MPGKTQKIEIEKIDGSIAIRVQNDDLSFGPYTYIKGSNVQGIIPDFQLDFVVIESDGNASNFYPYTDKLRIVIPVLKGDNLNQEAFDIQDVLNQPTWTADEAGFNQAMADINSWLSEMAVISADLTNIEGAITGSYQPDWIDLSSETFPYTLPADTYTSVTIVVVSGETIEFNGKTLTEGAYGFSGAGSKTAKSFTLDNPSNPTPASYLLVTSDV